MAANEQNKAIPTEQPLKKVEILLFSDRWIPPDSEEQLAMVRFYGKVLIANKERKPFKPLPSYDSTRSLSTDQIKSDWATVQFRLWDTYNVLPYEAVIFHRMLVKYRTYASTPKEIALPIFSDLTKSGYAERNMYEAGRSIAEGMVVPLSFDARRIAQQRLTGLFDTYLVNDSTRYPIDEAAALGRAIFYQFQGMTLSPETDTSGQQAIFDAITRPRAKYCPTFDTHQSAAETFEHTEKTIKPFKVREEYEAPILAMYGDFLTIACSSNDETPPKLSLVLREWVRRNKVIPERALGPTTYIEPTKYFIHRLVQAGIITFYEVDGEVYIFLHQPRANELRATMTGTATSAHEDN